MDSSDSGRLEAYDYSLDADLQNGNPRRHSLVGSKKPFIVEVVGGHDVPPFEKMDHLGRAARFAGGHVIGRFHSSVMLAGTNGTVMFTVGAQFGL
jgi:hypothetical protein